MMKIKRIIGGALESNGYIIYQQAGGESFIIDPGYNPSRFTDFVCENSLRIKGILLTHYHYDHVGAVEKLRKDFGCPVYMHRGDIPFYKGKIDKPLDDGDILMLENEKIVVMHTPGHTQGGVCFFSEESKLVFTGDTIFNVDIGRTDFDESDPYKMQDSMNDVVNKWGNDITIYPGHGDSATMKYVRKHNREFTDALL